MPLNGVGQFEYVDPTNPAYYYGAFFGGPVCRAGHMRFNLRVFEVGTGVVRATCTVYAVELPMELGSWYVPVSSPVSSGRTVLLQS